MRLSENNIACVLFSQLGVGFLPPRLVVCGVYSYTVTIAFFFFWFQRVCLLHLEELPDRQGHPLLSSAAQVVSARGELLFCIQGVSTE